MFIPLSTDRHTKRRPIVNETLVALNLLVYLIGAAGEFFGWFAREELMVWGWYDPSGERWWTLITYQFLHDPWGLGHIIFNLIFLWVFGNAVESRLGHAGYLGFYLIGGAVAGVAHGTISDAPVIGASGAIAGVSGGFLALFPRARIRIFVLFFIIGVIEIPALWFIGLYFALDVLNTTMGLLGRGGGGVAYAAHLGGYIYGFLVCFSLLGLGILKRDEFDAFYLFKQARRRKTFRKVTRQSQRVWDMPKADTAEQMSKRRAAGELSEHERELAERRAEISRFLAEHDLQAAAARYRELLDEMPDAVLPERRQLDLANQLYHEGDIEHAVRAYELLLAQYPACRDADQVRLILALIYTRREKKPQRARELLDIVRPKLAQAERELADQLLAELGHTA